MEDFGHEWMSFLEAAMECMHNVLQPLSFVMIS